MGSKFQASRTPVNALCAVLRRRNRVLAQVAAKDCAWMHWPGRRSVADDPNCALPARELEVSSRRDTRTTSTERSHSGLLRRPTWPIVGPSAVRWLPGTLLGFVLASLLVVTTPIGTGEGVHQDELLHPVLPHLHMIDGHIESHAEVDAAAARAPAETRRAAGPALGAGAGGEAAGLGVAIYPNLPVWLLVMPTDAVGSATAPNLLIPHEFLDAPPDPPPDFTG